MLNAQGLHVRAALFRIIREFFHNQGFIEVDTPIRQPVLIPEANILPVSSDGSFLQTSPELCMKRLLSGGATRIFQICPCFRKGERGTNHLEEFTMLEWYRMESDYTDLMDDCEQLVRFIVRRLADDCARVEMLTKVAGFAEGVELNSAWSRTGVAEAFARYSPVGVSEAMASDQFDELLVEHVEPNLGVGRPEFLMDYPAPMASLARRKADSPEIAERFELYISGIELANGFSELLDAKEQRQRFAKELELIGELRDEKGAMPEKFLRDLDSLDGRAAGIAFGVDRLLMLLTGKSTVQDVVSFAPDDL